MKRSTPAFSAAASRSRPWREPRRHGELVDLIGGISRKVLTQTLRRLQGYGLVDRHAEGGRVEYVLTDLGRTLVEPIAVLTEWAHVHGGAVVEFQESQADDGGAEGWFPRASAHLANRELQGQ
ncbi:helix-turn-helix transcriptional regulator [Streptomyces albiflaviniger]|nr:helix-turn-helix transcriptional regulator [Streptomyces albiflaviniger]